MILGDGDIASVLRDREGALFFACGVSNSSASDGSAFKRERDLIVKQPKHLCLFYFSSVSIYTVSSDYTRHKKMMENYVRRTFPNYNIIRLGNIDWGTNPHTFINYLKGKKARGEQYEVRDEYKFMISREQLLLVTDNLPLQRQNEINIFGSMAKVIDIIS